MDLSNKKVVVIGGSSGMGLATAKLLSGFNASVRIGGRDERKLQQVQKANQEIESYGVVDLEDENSVTLFFEATGAFDHLVVTGPSPGMHQFAELSLPIARKEFDAKFWGQHLAVYKSRPWIRDTGSVVLTSGAYGVRPDRGSSVMAIANGAIESLVKALAVELSPLRINAVAPGLIDTPLIRAMIPSEMLEDVFSQQRQTLLTKRVGQATDVAGAVHFLIHNPHITGSTIRVDGGTTLI